MHDVVGTVNARTGHHTEPYMLVSLGEGTQEHVNEGTNE